MACGEVACTVVGIQTVLDADQLGIYACEELVGRETAPFLSPEMLGPCHAMSRFDVPVILDSRQQCRDEITFLNEGDACRPYGRIYIENMQDLCPEAFRRIVIAGVTGNVGGVLGTLAGNEFRFLLARMVLPEHEHSVRIVLELLAQGKGTGLGIHEAGRACSGIDADGLYGRRVGAAGSEFPQYAFESLDVIQRMLAELLETVVAVESLSPSWIDESSAVADIPAVRIDQHGTA